MIEEEGSDEAAALIADTLLAPSLWIAECANALSTLGRKGVITFRVARSKLDDLRASTIVASPLEADLDAAMEIASALRHPIYDCIYLALALREGTHVITADRRFHQAVSRSGAYSGAVRMLVG